MSSKAGFAIDLQQKFSTTPSLDLVLPPGTEGDAIPVRTTTTRCFAELRQPWRELEARTPGVTPYQSHAWCSVWVEACAASGRPVDVRIVTVWSEGRLVLLWPLSLRRLGPIGILHALGEPATQYCDLLVEPSPRAAEWVEMAWRHIAEEPGVDLVHLHNVRSGGDIDRFGSRHFAQRIILEDVAPYLRLGGEGDGRPKQRSGRSINALKRHWRNLEKMGKVDVERIEPCRHVAATEEALDLKRLWLLERGAVSAGYDHPANRAVVSEMARRGLFLIFRLVVDGQTAAIEIGVPQNGVYFSLIQSYDRRFSAHAPGRLLLWKLFAQEDLGVDVFDFLAPAHPHKTEWTEAAVTVRDYAIPLSLRGRIAAFYLRTGKSLLKEGFAVLPIAVRCRVAELAHRFY